MKNKLMLKLVFICLVLGVMGSTSLYAADTVSQLTEQAFYTEGGGDGGGDKEGITA